MRAKPSRSKGRPRRRRFTAATADKYELYQEAVQSPDVDSAFLARIFRAARGREALHLREDFCGTALLCAHWIRRGPACTAEGFELDPEPVRWGLEHNFGPRAAARHARAPRAGEQGRFRLHLKDVRTPGHGRCDLRVAQNFSYWVLTTRAELVDYFRAARESLARDGMFVIDLYGGPEAQMEMEEKRRCGGFTYVWEQARYHPGTGEYRTHIHFRFPDGTALERAFSYRWRLWHLTELEDALRDAGFARVLRYFEGSDAKGTSGNGVYRRGVRGENCDSWLAYLAALR